MAKWLAATPATPNQVTVASFLIALVSMGFYLSGHNVLAGLSAQVSSIVDGVDGDLARTKNMATRFGGYLDAVLDRYADIGILAGMAYWSLNFEGSYPQGLILAVGLMAIAGTLMVSYTRARAEATLGDIFDGPAGFLASRDSRLLIIMIGSALAQVLATLVFLALLTNIVVVWRIVEARRLSGRIGGKEA